MKSDKSKKVSRYGVYKYIGEVKRMKKIQKKWHVDSKYPSRPNFPNFFINLFENYATKSETIVTSGFFVEKP